MSSADAINVGVDADGQPTKVTYGEMRMVAQEIHRLEKQARRIRFGALICIGLLVGTVIFGAVIALLVSAFKQTDVKEDGAQLALVKKDTQKVVATTQSLEDIDGSDLVDYARTRVDANGDPDGAWVLSDERISQIRTISWRAADPATGAKVTEVHQVAEIMRQNGKDTAVKITTKAGHVITIWDNTGGDNFDVMMKRWDAATKTFGPEFEVNADGDEADGRGRVLVSLTRPSLEARPRAINVDNFWD